MALREEIQAALNRASRESASNTPDHILATFLLSCLEAHEAATRRRDAHYGIAPEPGQPYKREEES